MGKTMKKIIIKLLSIVCYMLVLLVCIGFDITKLFSFRDLGLVLVGTFILTLPHMKEHKSREMGPVVGWNAMVTSYISTFVLLFSMMSKQNGVETLMPNIVICCRPILYGFIIYVILRKEPGTRRVTETAETVTDGGQEGEMSEETENGYRNTGKNGLTANTWRGEETESGLSHQKDTVQQTWMNVEAYDENAAATEETADETADENESGTPEISGQIVNLDNMAKKQVAVAAQKSIAQPQIVLQWKQEPYEQVAQSPQMEKLPEGKQIYQMFRNRGLTQREAEIARLILQGLTNGEIAEELCIAESTVKKHVSHIFEKLDVSRRSELFRKTLL